MGHFLTYSFPKSLMLNPALPKRPHHDIGTCLIILNHCQIWLTHIFELSSPFVGKRETKSHLLNSPHSAKCNKRTPSNGRRLFNGTLCGGDLIQTRMLIVLQFVLSNAVMSMPLRVMKHHDSSFRSNWNDFVLAMCHSSHSK